LLARKFVIMIKPPKLVLLYFMAALQ